MTVLISIGFLLSFFQVKIYFGEREGKTQQFGLTATLLAFSAYKVRDDIAPETPVFWEFAAWNGHHPLLLAIFQQGVIFFIV